MNACTGPRRRAFALFGNFLGAVYLSPFLGGMLADRYLGYVRSVLIGAALMAAGYFALAINSRRSRCMSAIALLVVGNGFFKPSIATLVGRLYAPDDSASGQRLYDLLHGHQHRRPGRAAGW